LGDKASRSLPGPAIALLLAALTVVLLVVTGLPLRYADTAWAGWMFALMGGPIGRAFLHRVGAVMMIGLSLYHVGFLLGTPRGRYELRELIPTKKDLVDLVHHLLYYLALRREPPRFGRFAYHEKFEYLAVVWGTVIMATTGLMLWFEVRAMAYFPKWVLDVCRVVHSYEALLAVLAIIISHLYHVHLRPGAFPMSRVWLDGRISESEMKEHHPLEYEALVSTACPAEEPTAPAAPEPPARAEEEGTP
ncbi:MAG: hypothetical protein QHJ73_17920, partial [Armatimonadota bacterium]|nr:hypothetical protein [Armatimonadota bacterium]